MTTINGSQHLTMALGNHPKSRTDLTRDEREPAGVILSSAYQEEDTLQILDGNSLVAFDVHEFSVMDDGMTAIIMTRNVQTRNVTGLPRFGNLMTSKVRSSGFREIDVATRKAKFVWNTLDHGVNLIESYNEEELDNTKWDPYWDFL